MQTTWLYSCPAYLTDVYLHYTFLKDKTKDFILQ